MCCRCIRSLASFLQITQQHYSSANKCVNLFISLFSFPTMYLFLFTSNIWLNLCQPYLLDFFPLPQHSYSALLWQFPSRFPSSFIIQRVVAWMSTDLDPNFILRYHMRHRRATSIISNCLSHVMLQQHFLYLWR